MDGLYILNHLLKIFFTLYFILCVSHFALEQIFFLMEK